MSTTPLPPGFSRVPVTDIFDDEQALDFTNPDTGTSHVYAGPSLIDCPDDLVGTPPLRERFPLYQMPTRLGVEVLSVMEKPTRNNIWLFGPSGAGKSDFVRELHARIKCPLWEINAHEHMTPANLFGRTVVRNASTQFVEGVVPRWLRCGGTLLINEYTTLRPDVMNVLKSVLEVERTLTLTESEDLTPIVGHPSCRLIVTDNTNGRGDDSGLYVNTNAQSVADLRRFSAFFELDYLSADEEKALLRRFADGIIAADAANGLQTTITDDTIAKIVKVATSTRTNQKTSATTRSLSTGDLLNWLENAQILPTIHDAARVSFLSSYSPGDLRATSELINAEFGAPDTVLWKTKAQP